MKSKLNIVKNETDFKFKLSGEYIGQVNLWANKIKKGYSLIHLDFNQRIEFSAECPVTDSLTDLFFDNAHDDTKSFKFQISNCDITNIILTDVKKYGVYITIIDKKVYNRLFNEKTIDNEEKNGYFSRVIKNIKIIKNNFFRPIDNDEKK